MEIISLSLVRALYRSLPHSTSVMYKEVIHQVIIQVVIAIEPMFFFEECKDFMCDQIRAHAKCIKNPISVNRQLFVAATNRHIHSLYQSKLKVNSPTRDKTLSSSLVLLAINLSGLLAKIYFKTSSNPHFLPLITNDRSVTTFDRKKLIISLTIPHWRLSRIFHSFKFFLS